VTSHLHVVPAPVQPFSLDRAQKAVHARLCGYTKFLALLILSFRTDAQGAFELTIEDMADLMGFSTSTARRALWELIETRAIERSGAGPRLACRYAWNVETLNAWVADGPEIIKGSSTSARRP
jgi:hypothetical protein